MNVFLKKALGYLGMRDIDSLSRTDKRRVRAKAKKMKVSNKKAQREQSHNIIKQYTKQ